MNQQTKNLIKEIDKLLKEIPTMYIEDVNQQIAIWTNPANEYEVKIFKALHDRRAILFIADQLLNAWEYFYGVDETVKFMNTDNEYDDKELRRCINDWFDNKDNMRTDCEMMKKNVDEFLSNYKLLHTGQS